MRWHWSRALILLLWLISSLLAQPAWSHHEKIEAQNGVLDLQYWPFDTDELLDIQGEWLFYPQQLLLLSDLSHRVIPDSQYLPQGLLDCSQSALKEDKLCYATYVLELRHLPEQPLAIFVPEVASAFKLFWNHQLIAYGGRVSSDPGLFQPYSGHRIAHLPTHSSRGVLVLQVANLFGADPAPIRGLLLGESTTVQERFAAGELFQALLGALAGIAAILFLLQYLVRHRYEKGLWGLSLFSLAVMLYIYSVGYTVISWFQLDNTWVLALRLNNFAQSLFLPCLVFWYQHHAGVFIPSVLIRLLWLQLIVVAPVMLLLPQNLLIGLEGPLMWLHLLLATVIVVNLCRCGREGWRHMLPQFAVLISCLLTAIHDVLLHQQWLTGSDWLPVSLVLFIIAQIFMLAVSRSQQHTRLEQLNRLLSSGKNKLQQSLDSRSQELQSKVDELESIQEELKYLQRYDELTGLLRQGVFQRECQQLVQGMVLSDQPVALILLDIDRFKQISAQYGYAAGDQVMKDVAHLLEQWSGEQRWACRMEGESFALFALDMDEDQALQEAESLRLRIRQWAVILHESTEQDISFHFSTSFGLSSCQADEATIERLIKEADLALNKAKSQGRNCVVSYSHLLDRGAVQGAL